MMYTRINFNTKKALKEAVSKGKVVTIFQPNDMFGNPKASPTYTGNAYLEGPHYPKPHRWYAEAKIVRGSIVSVK